MLFDKICRRNGITHLLTAPSSPNQNGKVERFHGTFRPDFLDEADPFETIEAAQAAVDAWVEQYNTDRPHQGLHEKVPVTPADRFAPVPAAERDLLRLWLPPTLEPVAGPGSDATGTSSPRLAPAREPGAAVELEKVVPASGNMQLCGQQFWLGPRRVGQVVRFWVDADMVHLSIGGTRVKTVRSRLSVTDLAQLCTEGAVPAGSPPLPSSVEPDDVVEVERAVSRAGTVAMGGQVVLAAEILAGRQVGIRIDGATLMFFDLETRELLRTRPNPIPPDKTRFLRGVRPLGPHHGPRLSRSPCNAGRPTPASSKCAVRRSPSAERTGTTPSPSTSPRPPWPSGSTTRPESCGAPRPHRCATSKSTGRTGRPSP